MSHLARSTAAKLTAVARGTACAHAQGPLLHPDAKLREAGETDAEAEISACRSLADDYVSPGAVTAKEIGKDTAVGGAGGRAESAGPSPVYRGFVDRCLRERSYEAIGWQLARPNG